MTAEKCHTCVYYDELFGADDDDPAKGLCYFPSALLPLSMAGYANRERETVEANATGCPTWTASAQPAQAVAEVGQQFRVWLETVVLANSEDEALAKLVDPKCSSRSRGRNQCPHPPAAGCAAIPFLLRS
jgi:hypothetical protein